METATSDRVRRSYSKRGNMSFDLKKELGVSRHSFDGTMSSFQSLTTVSGQSHADIAAKRAEEQKGKPYVNLAPLRPTPTSFLEDGQNNPSKSRLKYDPKTGFTREPNKNNIEDSTSGAMFKSRRLPSESPFAPNVRTIGMNDKGDLLVSDTDFARSRKQKFVEAHIPPAPVPSKMHTHTHEVQVLEKWMKKVFKQNVKKSVDTPAILNDLHVHSLCFHEAVRQTCMHCMDLGRILASIWNGYIELFERVLSHYHHRLAAVEAENTVLAESLEKTQNEKEEVVKEHKDLETRFGAVQRSLADKDEKMKVYDENNRILEQECTRMRKLIDLVGDQDRGVNPSQLAPELNTLSSQLTSMVEEIDSESQRTNALLGQMNVLFEYALETEGSGELVRKSTREGPLGSGAATPQSRSVSRVSMKKETTVTMVQTDLSAMGKGPLPVKCPNCGTTGHAVQMEPRPPDAPLSRQSSHARIGMTGAVAPSAIADPKASSAKGDVPTSALPQPLIEFVGVLTREKCANYLMNKDHYSLLVDRLLIEKALSDNISDERHERRRTVPEFVYDFITKKYGSKSTAEEEIVRLVNTTKVMVREGSVKARVFARLIGGVDGFKICSYYEMNSALHVNNLLQRITFSVGRTTTSTKDRVHTVDNVVELMKDAFPSIAPEILEAAIGEIQKLGAANNGMVFQENILEIAMRLTVREVEAVTEDLRTSFRNADTRGDNVFNLDGFGKLLEMAVNESVPERDVQNMFKECFSGASSENQDKITENTFIDVAIHHNMHEMLRKRDTRTREVKLNEANLDDYTDFDKAMLIEAVEKVKPTLKELQQIVEGTPDEKEMRKIYNKLKEFLAQSSITAVEQSWNLYRQLVLAINRIATSLQDYKKK